ncbi:MAG: hypothetical protein AB7N65_06475 [Vicinamibacterales bacterium]
MHAALRSLALIVCGGIVGGVLVSQWDHQLSPATTVAGQSAVSPSGGVTSHDGAEAPTVDAEIASLKDVRPSQAHAMMDVGYNWTNLWFAGEQKNWGLARFYFNESRSHIRWAIRIRPIRKAPDGSDVDLKAIFDAIDTTTLEQVKTTIEAKDSAAFVKAYREMLESCYACHKANGFDYLRPAMPTRPAQTIIAFDPKATWPQ